MSNILLIDNDHDLGLVLKEMLEVLGHQVRFRVSETERGIKETFDEVKPELVIADIAVSGGVGPPDTRGMDCLVSLRSIPGGERLPALAYSADDECLSLQRQQLSQLGVEVEEHPTDWDRLAGAITRSLGER